MKIEATPLQIPLEFLTVNYLCPSLVYGKKEIDKEDAESFLLMKKLVNSARKKLTKYTKSLSKASSVLVNKGMNQLSRDLMNSCELIRRRFDDLANIIEALESKELPETIVPAHGNKASLVRDCLDININRKRPGLKEGVPRKYRKEIYAFLRLASNSRPLIIHKQPELSDIIDINDIWNHRSIMKFP